MEKTKEAVMEELKRTLYKDIELQEKIREQQSTLWAEHAKLREDAKKTRNRLLGLFVLVSMVFLTLLGSILYFVTRPAAASEVDMRTISDLNKNLLTQRKFNNEDRKDIAEARNKYFNDQLQKVLHERDSLLKITKSVKK